MQLLSRRFALAPQIRGLAAPLLLLTACDGATSPVLRAALRADSDRSTYVLTVGPPPAITLHHTGGPAVVISGCPEAPSAILERRTATAWAEEATRGMLCLATLESERVTLAPGQARTFAVAPWRAGTYRVRVLIGPSALDPQRTILSNEFDVH